jgi:hypothetical protein
VFSFLVGDIPTPKIVFVFIFLALFLGLKISNYFEELNKIFFFGLGPLVTVPFFGL